MQDLNTDTQEQEQTNPEEDTRSPEQQVEDLLFPPPGNETETDQELDQDLDQEEEEEQEDQDQDQETDQEEIDYTQEIPLSTGEKVPLGKLKDAYQEQSARLLEVQTRENQIAQKTTHMKEMAEWLNVVPREHQERAAAEIQQQASQELDLLLDAIPSWKDKEGFNLGKKAVFDLANEYGIGELLAGINDHRAIKLLHDFQELRNTIAKAKKEVKPLKRKLPGSKKKTPGSKTQSLVDKAKQTGNRSDQVAAVSALIG